MKAWNALLALAMTAGLAQIAAAGDCCQSCGCDAPCKRVTCKIVADKVKEKHHFYVCECEDFCVPGPCHKKGGCGSSCGCASDCTGGCGSCAVAVPSECHIYTRTKVVKYECEYEKCIYKCEVVELCGNCCDGVHACDGVLPGDVNDGHEVEGSPSDAMPPMPPALPSSARRPVKTRGT